VQIEDYIKLEQTKAVYENTKIIILGMVGVSLATVYIFWTQSSPFELLLWLVAAVGVIVGRLLTLRAFRLNNVSFENSQFWLNLSLLWSFITGLHWGLVPAYFLSTNEAIYTLLVSIMYTGHLAGAISTNSAYSHGFIAVGIPTTLCFAGRFFYEGGSFYNTLGVMVIFYFGVSALLSRNSAKLFREARELLFKNIKLMDQLVVQKNAAEQATQSKDRFLAAASHDLRQPLHSSGLLVSALDEYVTDPKGRALLGDIRMSGEALSHSFNSLLDVSRLDAGVIESNPRHLRFDNYVQSLLRDCQIQASEKGLNFTSEGQDIAIYSDPILLERILHNLISNAVAYTPSGTITITWSKVDSLRARIVIEDMGIGIDPANLNDIFSEYYQINNPERDRKNGFGLGLAIVQRLCNILDIKLYISSTLGFGTTIALYTQLGDLEQVVDKQKSARSIASLNNITVLVIDDDPVVRKSMKHALTAWGCQVLTAESQDDAVNITSQLEANLDLIIADYRLKDNLTGTEAIERICDELNKAIPSIVVTADTSPERLQQLTISGFPVLHKPVSAAALRSAIQRQVFV